MFYLMFLFTALFQDLPNWGNFNEVLLFLVAGGSAIVVNALLAFLAENFQFWHKIAKNGKLLISLLLSVGIGAGAYYLLSLPDLITFIQPYWALIVTIVLAWLGSQFAYMKAKASGYAVKTRASALGLKQK